MMSMPELWPRERRPIGWPCWLPFGHGSGSPGQATLLQDLVAKERAANGGPCSTPPGQSRVERARRPHHLFATLFRELDGSTRRGLRVHLARRSILPQCVLPDCARAAAKPAAESANSGDAQSALPTPLPKTRPGKSVSRGCRCRPKRRVGLLSSSRNRVVASSRASARTCALALSVPARNVL